MLVIGLTGGIGAGKTTVADLFAERGVPIIDADVIARELTLPAEPAFKTILAHFGHSILADDGSLNRNKLRDLIFQQPKERKWLEDLLHPLIKARIQQQIQLIKVSYCIVVIPLLVETNAYPFLDRILVIDTPEDLQINRVTARDQSDANRIATILKSQANREQRLNVADDVIRNDGSLADLTKQVEILHLAYSHT